MDLFELVLHVDKSLGTTQSVKLFFKNAHLFIIAFDLLVNTGKLVLFKLNLIGGVSLPLLTNVTGGLTPVETILTAHQLYLLVTGFV